MLKCFRVRNERQIYFAKLREENKIIDIVKILRRKLFYQDELDNWVYFSSGVDTAAFKNFTICKPIFLEKCFLAVVALKLL